VTVATALCSTPDPYGVSGFSRTVSQISDSGRLSHAIAAVAAKSTIAGTGLPPMMNTCVITAPIIVTARASAPKKAFYGTSSSTALVASIVPVR
jgi:hypothetical protein